MSDRIKDIIINTYDEIIDDEKIVIGNYYTLIKEYNPYTQYVFRAKLKKIITNVYKLNDGTVANYYIFDDYVFYYIDNKEINLPAPYHIIPKDSPWTRFVPDKNNSRLISLKFYERKAIEPNFKQQFLSFYPFYKLKKVLSKKTSIPEELLQHEIAKYLV
jgi:hypothetical protein